MPLHPAPRKVFTLISGNFILTYFAKLCLVFACSSLPLESLLHFYFYQHSHTVFWCHCYSPRLRFLTLWPGLVEVCVGVECLYRPRRYHFSLTTEARARYIYSVAVQFSGSVHGILDCLMPHSIADFPAATNAHCLCRLTSALERQERKPNDVGSMTWQKRNIHRSSSHLEHSMIQLHDLSPWSRFIPEAQASQHLTPASWYPNALQLYGCRRCCESNGMSPSAGTIDLSIINRVKMRGGRSLSILVNNQ